MCSADIGLGTLERSTGSGPDMPARLKTDTCVTMTLFREVDSVLQAWGNLLLGGRVIVDGFIIFQYEVKL